MLLSLMAVFILRGNNFWQLFYGFHALPGQAKPFFILTVLAACRRLYLVLKYLSKNSARHNVNVPCIYRKIFRFSSFFGIRPVPNRTRQVQFRLLVH